MICELEQKDNQMLPMINVGDYIIHPQVYILGDRQYQRRYDILAV